MTDQPQTPSTEAGKALVSEHGHKFNSANHLAVHILAIEAEARAQANVTATTGAATVKVFDPKAQAEANATITALREALEAACDYMEADKDEFPEGTYSMFRLALRDTASAATEYEARLKAEAVKPWREALAEAHEHDGHTTWCNFVEVENRDKCECGFYERFEKARALLSGDGT